MQNGTSRGGIQPNDLWASVPRPWFWGRRSMFWPSSPSTRDRRGSRGMWSVTNVSIASRLSFDCGSLVFTKLSRLCFAVQLQTPYTSECAACVHHVYPSNKRTTKTIPLFICRDTQIISVLINAGNAFWLTLTGMLEP